VYFFEKFYVDGEEIVMGVRARLGYPTPESWMLGTNKVCYTVNMIFE
jgi:hypothetical protein